MQVWETANAKTDLGSQIIAEAVPSASVKMTPIGDGFYTTLCLPYDVTVGNAKVYILAPDQYDIPEEYVLLTMIGNTVPAGTPVVLWGESETATLSYGAGFAAQPSTATALNGLFVPANPVGVLTLQGQDNIPGFYAFSGETIEPNQAYLKPKDSGIQSLLLKFSDIEDGIEEIQNPESEIQDGVAIYDLSGRKVTTGQWPKGLYIINNKKAIRK